MRPDELMGYEAAWFWHRRGVKPSMADMNQALRVGWSISLYMRMKYQLDERDRRVHGIKGTEGKAKT